MAKVILKFNNEVIDHIDLKQGDMKIGRKSSNDIFVDNLAVSGVHANIFTIGEDSFVQDMGSTNGTFVNNKQITKHHLKHGDVITIGKHALVYMTESDGAEERTEDFAKTVIISADELAEAPEPVGFDITKDTIAVGPKNKAKPEQSAPQSKGQGAIFVLSGANSGKRIELTRSITNLGKTGKVGGSIKRTPDGYRLMASADTDAPKLNGRSVPLGDGEILKNGDIIEVVGTRLQFYIK